MILAMIIDRRLAIDACQSSINAGPQLVIPFFLYFRSNEMKKYLIMVVFHSALVYSH